MQCATIDPCTTTYVPQDGPASWVWVVFGLLFATSAGVFMFLGWKSVDIVRDIPSLIRDLKKNALNFLKPPNQIKKGN
jgi:hypothetical protein